MNSKDKDPRKASTARRALAAAALGTTVGLGGFTVHALNGQSPVDDAPRPVNIGEAIKIEKSNPTTTISVENAPTAPRTPSTAEVPGRDEQVQANLGPAMVQERGQEEAPRS